MNKSTELLAKEMLVLMKDATQHKINFNALGDREVVDKVIRTLENLHPDFVKEEIVIDEMLQFVLNNTFSNTEEENLMNLMNNSFNIHKNAQN